jgi:signal transduction histidine kinase/ActR/RegA family two-component response regulator
MTLADLRREEDCAGALPDLSPLQLGQTDRILAETCFHHSGAEVWVEMVATLLRDDFGKPSQITVLLLDVTDRKRAEEVERRSRIELEQLNATLEARVRDRTAVAQRRAEQLRALTLDLTEAESRERRRLAQLLHDDFQQLVSAAKLKAGLVRGRIDEEQTVGMMKQLEGLLDQAIQASRSLVTELTPPLLHDAGLAPALFWLARRMERDHALRVDVRAEENVEVESEQVRTILFECARELLFNITKHAGVQDARVELAAEEGLLRLCVSDAGVGFDPDAMAEAQASKGSFGLFSLRERLTLIGGLAHIRSAPGAGTEVEMVLPIAMASTWPPAQIADDDAEQADFARVAAQASIDAPAGLIASGEPAATPRVRVLVADDHKMFREGLISLVSQEPYVEIVGEASDGKQALDLARQLRPDVLICDVSMPELNGIQVTTAIARELPRTRVIGLSMHEREDMAVAMRGAGAAAYCAKSGPSDVLLDALRQVAGVMAT